MPRNRKSYTARTRPNSLGPHAAHSHVNEHHNTVKSNDDGGAERAQRFLSGGQSSAASGADHRRLRASSFTLRFSGCVCGGAGAGAGGARRGTSDTHTSPTCSRCTRSPYCASVRSGRLAAQPRPYTKNGCSTVDSSSTWNRETCSLLCEHTQYWLVS